MGTVVLDSSVLLALLDPHDAHHLACRAAYPVPGSRHITSTSALAEVLVGASRLGGDAVAAAEARVDVIVDQVCPVDRAVARAAAGIRAEHPTIRLPDALILATAATAEADVVLTADRRLGAVDRRVRVVA